MQPGDYCRFITSGYEVPSFDILKIKRKEGYWITSVKTDDQIRDDVGNTKDYDLLCTSFRKRDTE